jgi:hypothetical protein
MPNIAATSPDQASAAMSRAEAFGKRTQQSQIEGRIW